MTKHELKTWPSGFQAIVDGDKTNEYRVNDRNFQVDDILHLREWVPTDQYIDGITGPEYTGRECMVKVTHITHCDQWGGTEGHVVMSFNEKFVWHTHG